MLPTRLSNGRAVVFFSPSFVCGLVQFAMFSVDPTQAEGSG